MEGASGATGYQGSSYPMAGFVLGKASEKGKGYALGLVKETLTGKRPNVCCCLPALQGDQPSKESGESGLGRDLARQLWRNGKRKSGKEVRL